MCLLIFFINKLVFLYLQMLLDREQNISAPSMGRFGTTISSLADLNGDGLRDVAVAAPLEDDNRGAVYIFLGDKHRGIRSTFSQVRQKQHKGKTESSIVVFKIGK